MERDLSNAWKVHTVNLLREIVENNHHMAIFTQPINIFGHMLHDIAKRSSQLNDPILNDLMMRLALYEAGDPESKDFDPKLMEAVHQKAEQLRKDIAF
jgi:hypothetical protein